MCLCTWINVSYHFILQGLGLINISSVKSKVCFKINSESLEVSWDLGATWEVRSMPSTPKSPPLYLETGQAGICHPPPPCPKPSPPSCSQITCHHRSCRGEPNAAPSVKPGRNCKAMLNLPEKSVLITGTSKLFFRSDTVVSSCSVQTTCVTERYSQQGLAIQMLPFQLGSSSLSNSPLRITMICGWAKETLLCFLKPSGVQSPFYCKQLWIHSD